MSCPTCEHTMQTIAFRILWCPRCGTLKSGTSVYVPDVSKHVANVAETCAKIVETFKPAQDLRGAWNGEDALTGAIDEIRHYASDLEKKLLPTEDRVVGPQQKPEDSPCTG